MTTNLEDMAKQVSLLSRLVELLRMQEEPVAEGLQSLGWVVKKAKRTKGVAPRDLYYHPAISYGEWLQGAWNHPITQKAWSDDLVKVAKELNKIPLYPFIEEGLNVIRIELNQPHDWNPLKTILNKYKRSLDE